MRLDKLDQEICDLAATLRNHADTRQHHPTYGMTRRTLLDDVARLEGALIARAALLGHPLGARAMAARVQAIDLGLDLSRLQTLAETA